MDRPSEHRVRTATVLALTTCGLALLIGWLALHDVEGAVRVDRNTYSTEFVNGEWVMASWLLVVPTALAAWLNRLAGVVTALSCGSVGVGVSLVTMQRYDESGWSDGLEGLALVAAVLAGLVLLAAAATAGARGQRSREHDASIPSPRP